MNYKSIYIITKPLQYINATNIPDTNQKYLIIINNFSEVQEFYHAVKSHSSLWVNIRIFNSKYFAIIWLIIMHKKLKISNIYIDSDYGIILHFLLYFLKNKIISIYEEGWGTYREIRQNDTFITKLKNQITSFLGNENKIGGSRFTSNMYLYHIDFYNETFKKNTNKLHNFKLKFVDHINSSEEFKYIFKLNDLSSLKGQSVLIYLTSYSYDERIENYLSKYQSLYKILKPHPHIKHINKKNKFDQVINNIIPAEFIINALLKVVKDIIIIHHGSTSILSFINDTRITELNIETNSNEFFNSFTKYLKNTHQF